jgi:hypothetical protein
VARVNTDADVAKDAGVSRANGQHGPQRTAHLIGAGDQGARAGILRPPRLCV